MENAADALKMAFAVFVFVVAISLTFSSFTKAKEAADAVLWYTDKTNYYQWVESAQQENGREVTRDAIIASLFRKQTDTHIVIIKDSTERYTFSYYGNVTILKGGKETGKKTNVSPSSPDYFNLINFINTDFLGNHGNVYYENIVEVTNKGSLGGEYVIGDDGTKLQVTQGDHKVIVTYTLKK